MTMSSCRRKRTRRVFTMELLEEEFLDQPDFDHKISRSGSSHEAAKVDDPPTVMSLSSGGTASPHRRRGGSRNGESLLDQPLHDAKIPYSSGNRTHRRVVSSTPTTRRVFVVPPSRQMKRTRRHNSRTLGAASPATKSSASVAHREGVHLSKLSWCVRHRDLVTPAKSDLQGQRLSADPRSRGTLLTGPLAFFFPEWKLQEIDRMDRSRQGHNAFAPSLASIKVKSPSLNGSPSERKDTARKDGASKFTWLSQDRIGQRLDWISSGEELEGFRLGGKLKGKKLGYSGFWEVDTIKDDFSDTLAC